MRQAKFQRAIEDKLMQDARELGFSAGYIGNFERWGDERKLMIWNKGETIWSCEALALNDRSCGQAYLSMAKALQKEVTQFVDVE